MDTPDETDTQGASYNTAVAQDDTAADVTTPVQLTDDEIVDNCVKLISSSAFSIQYVIKRLRDTFGG